MDQEELIRRCRAGERAAWEEFVDRFYGLAKKAVTIRFFRCGVRPTDGMVEEVVQDFFLKLLRTDSLKGIKSEAMLRRWVIVGAGRRAIDHLRTQRVGKVIGFDDIGADESTQDLLVSEKHLERETPRDEASYHEVKALITRFFETLPPKARLIMELACHHEKTHDEIAGLTGISINTVSTVLRRTRERLRRYVKRQGIENF